MTEPLDETEIEELIGAYALDAVDPDERAAVEAHLLECPRCRAELAEHLETAAYLSYGGAPAPEALWGRIAAALEEAPPAMRLQVVDSSSDVPAPALPPAVAPVTAIGRARSRRRLAGVLAVAAALIVVALGAAVIHQRNQIDDLHRAEASGVLARAAHQAQADPDSQRLSLTSPAHAGVTATAVISPSGTGYLMAADLPSLASDRTYQLWGETGGKVISLGLLGRSPSLVAFSAHGTFHGLAVTDEVAGGVAASSQTPVLTS